MNVDDIRKHRVAMVLAAAAAVAVPAGSSAHHSYAQYDRCRRVTLEGEIEGVTWANPHVVIALRTDDATRYVVEWASLQQLRRMDVPEKLLEGDRIAVTGSPNRDPDKKIVTLLTEIRRVGDDWSWSRARPIDPKSCGA
ncbi:MAG: hypothetical protein JXB36_07410 [Gammaproteobacteria bacterium]|nr:hypothetical protein [Gammaproteobacteria bacterium]